VLIKHGIITYQGNLVSLNTKKLTFEQKSQLRMPIPVKSATHSGGSRPGIPVEVGHLFR